jgi:hypothetical protein
MSFLPLQSCVKLDSARACFFFGGGGALEAVPWLRLSVTGLSLRKPGFDAG